MTALESGQHWNGRAALGAAYVKALAVRTLPVCVALWVFSGGFVFIEPAPYELIFIATFAIGLAGGLRIYRRTLPVLYITLAFAVFALVAIFQMRYQATSDGLIYNLVTIFLFITTYFTANFVAQSPLGHTRLIAKAHIAVALIASVVGILAYLGALPGEGIFLLYGRARAFFNDPNVFGPFLILPAMFALQRVLLGSGHGIIWNALAYLIMFVAIFVSFSRGAWGHLAVSSATVFLMVFLLECSVREQVRLLLYALGGVMALAAAIVGLLSIPAVADLFAVRFSLAQSYDTGELGRFGRIWYTIDVLLSNPLGIGPLEYGYMRITEQPHNTYLNVGLSYGWGGALCYYALVVWTLIKAFACLARPSPNRLLLIPVLATLIPLLVLSGIIDTDHWRHWFFVVGVVWGICAGYERLTARQVTQRLVP